MGMFQDVQEEPVPQVFGQVPPQPADIIANLQQQLAERDAMLTEKVSLHIIEPPIEECCVAGTSTKFLPAGHGKTR